MRLSFVFIRVLLAVGILPAVAEDASLQTLRGTLVPCEIDVPSTWRVRTNEGTIAAIGDGMQILVHSDQHVGDSHAAAKAACDGARALMPDAEWTEARAIKVAGAEWLEYTITGTLEKQAMTFLNYTHSGRAGTFTIIAQAIADEFPKKRDTLVRYMNTFRFPKPAESPSG
jgi:hypothetical protein